MEIRNITPEEREIPNVGFVEAGGTIEVPDELGANLIEQVDNFEKVTKRKGAS